MIRKALIALSLLCVVLCAFVGYLSNQAIQESKKAKDPPTVLSCKSLMAEQPVVTTHVKLTGFKPGKHLINVDINQDREWDSLCVPFFPNDMKKIGHGYSAVLVYFKDVHGQEAFDAAVKQDIEGIETNFWPLRQELDPMTHSLLAQKYNNLDFANSPILHFGYKADNPVLGETSLMASVGVACLAIFVAFVALISGFIFRKRPQRTRPEPEEDDGPVTNRAGLPVSGEGSAPEKMSIFDQVTSLRDQPPQGA